MIGQTFSHYRIIKELGKGGMGVVYLAEDTVLGRQVAIKTLIQTGGPGRKHYHTRFLREAQAVSALSHPHIAAVHDYGETPEGQPYIVMEFVKGGTLADLLSKEPLAISRTLEIIKQVAEALNEAHRHGIVHRDIKPSNVGITDRGEVKVLDFGLAKQLTQRIDDRSCHADQTDDQPLEVQLNTQTTEGVRLGTPMYLSPEQAIGVPVDTRSDLFSLGSVLYECIAGTPAFSGMSDIDICAKVVRDDPPPPSQMNPEVIGELDRIALKGLAKRPDDRYQSASELIADLSTVNESARVGPKVTNTTKNARKTQSKTALTTLSDVLRTRRLSVGYVLLGLLIIAVLGVGLWAGLRPKPHQPPSDAQHFYELGLAAMREGAFYKATKRLQRSVDLDPNFALAHARLSEAWTEVDFSDKAQDELIRAQELDRSLLNELDSLRLHAITNTVKRDFHKAVEEYQRLLQVVPEVEKKFAYVDLGRAYEKNEETLKAVDCYQEATKIDSNYAAAFLRLGVALRRNQKFTAAQSAFDVAYSQFDITNEIEGLTEVFYQRGMLFSQQGKVVEARQAFQTALERSAVLENKDQQIRTLLQLSNVSILAGDSKKAEQYSQEGLQLAKSNSIENLATAGLIDIANSFFVRGEFGRAESYFSQALQLAQNYKGKRNEARALLSLASLRTHQSRPDEVRQLVERSISFYRQGGYRKETSQAYAILGHAQDQLGNYTEAIKAFEEQLKLAEQVGDPQQLASTHEGLGVVLNHQQNYPAALVHFDEQEKIVKGLGNKLVHGYALMNRGTMLWQLGRYNDAEKDLSAALSIAVNPDEKPHKELLAWIHVSKGQLALSRRDSPVATSESKEAMKLAGTEFKAIAVHAGYTLGLAQSLSGQTNDGRKSCEDAVRLARELHDPLPLSHALLALGETSIASGNDQNGLTTTREAQTLFAAGKQYHSEWRAWLIQANAATKMHDSERARVAASQAAVVLGKLEEQCGAEYQFFLTRPDVKHLLDMKR